MGVIGKIFGGGAAEVAGEVGNLVDRFVHTKEEQAELKMELERLFLKAEEVQYKNITERWQADMSSDSWLSKNVRPLVLIFLIFTTVLLIFIEAGVISFEVKAEWIALLQLILTTVIASYFGGRSFEKVRSIDSKKKAGRKGADIE
jgi:cation transport ATPase